eukprot:TRINITY_DN9875_c0_g1_i1.p1 TRINITY_DN9875_c0_g1~~TRINITY_DN9875_c0_g1_i1.p1  ORF type:complete len:184 (-),score=19.43 TRINITY_DN9875_c0_g1_i1:227-778(-)
MLSLGRLSYLTRGIRASPARLCPSPMARGMSRLRGLVTEHRELRKFQDKANNAIDQAIYEGDFDGLTGPPQYDSKDDVYVPAGDRLVNRVLKNASAKPGWVQHFNDAELAIKMARKRLSEAYLQKEKYPYKWTDAQAFCRAEVARANEHIRLAHLNAPSVSHRMPFDADREIERVMNGGKLSF